MHPSLMRLQAQWQENRRLRLATLVALFILLINVVASLSGRQQAAMEAYQRDARLEASLRSMPDELLWRDRARQVRELRDGFRQGLTVVQQPGMAKAAMQVWLGSVAAQAQLGTPSFKVEDPVEVPEHPDFLQVVARLEGSLPDFGHKAFLDALATGMPWIQVERMEMSDTSGARVNVVVRGYFQQAAADNGGEP